MMSGIFPDNLNRIKLPTCFQLHHPYIQKFSQAECHSKVVGKPGRIPGNARSGRNGLKLRVTHHAFSKNPFVYLEKKGKDSKKANAYGKQHALILLFKSLLPTSTDYKHFLRDNICTLVYCNPSPNPLPKNVCLYRIDI